MSENQEWRGNGWTQYQKLVLAELERLSEGNEAISERLNKIEINIAMLQVKSGLWGLIGGSIPVMIMIAVEVMKK